MTIAVLDKLLAQPPALCDANIDAWHQQWLLAFAQEPDLFAATLTAGFCSDRVAGAFVAGYQSAVRRLVPALETEQAFITLSVTEEEGNRPRNIKSQLSDADGTLRLNGHKRWASLSAESNLLLVAARRNAPEEARPELVLIQLPMNTKGVTVEPMPPTAFTPEVSHGRIHLDSVVVPQSTLLPGDGYSDYIKPFRMIEDTFVSTAITACLLRLANDSGWSGDDQLALMSVLSLLAQVTSLPLENPLTHLFFEQANNTLQGYVDFEQPRWQLVSETSRTRWQRDAPLLGIAKLAAGIRRERAFAYYNMPI
jgi:hypothetical protein